MGKTYDISKLRKGLTKSISGIGTGFHNPDVWLNTGCYVLNYIISADFNRGVPLDKITMFAGSSGSGKSYITSGNLVKDALSKGVIVCLIDSEDALTEEWMNNLGVDTNNENLIRVQTNSIEKVMQTVTEMTNWYSETFAETPREEQPGMYFVIDSLGALFPEDETKRFDEGELSMTDGMRNAGAKTKLMNHLINKTAGQKMGAAITNHVYASTELYSPDKIGGGNKAIFLSSIIVQMEKLMLKEDEQGNKTTEILGIRATCIARSTNP